MYIARGQGRYTMTAEKTRESQINFLTEGSGVLLFCNKIKYLLISGPKAVAMQGG